MDLTGEQANKAFRFRRRWWASSIRFFGLLGLAFLVFAILLLAFGKNPLKAYTDIFSSTLGSTYGFSEILVKMIPLTLTAVAVAVPSRIWLINVGGEGQLYIGALFATWGALTFNTLARMDSLTYHFRSRSSRRWTVGFDLGNPARQGLGE